MHILRRSLFILIAIIVISLIGGDQLYHYQFGQEDAFSQSAPNVPFATSKDFKFTSRSTSGVPTTLSGGTAACYKAGSTTESTTGVTLTADYDARTGFNDLTVNLAADTTFYAANTDIQCVLTAGTVAGTSVAGEVIVQFHISSDYTVVKGVAFPNYPIWMVSANGTAVTGISPACQIAKDNGAFAAIVASPVERSNGSYRIDLSATETNANAIVILCTGVGAQAYRAISTPLQ